MKCAAPLDQIKLDPIHRWMLKQYRWKVTQYGYVHRSTRLGGRRPGSRSINVYLHRAVMGLEYGDPREVDHLNGDPLDNRIVNLEIVSHAENVRRQYARTPPKQPREVKRRE